MSSGTWVASSRDDAHRERTTSEDASGAEDLLLSHMLRTVLSLVPAAVAVGGRVGTAQTLEPLVVVGAHPHDAEAAAPLIRCLADLEPIDPFNPRRAAAVGASVMWAADAGGTEHVAASMYGRHLSRHGYGPPLITYFRAGGRIVSGLLLLRTADAPPFEAREAELLLGLRPFLEMALAFTGDAQPVPEPDRAVTAALTGREREVAGLVASGLSNADIALALGMSRATVKAHLTRVYAKLGVRSRTQLAVLLPRAADPRPDCVT